MPRKLIAVQSTLMKGYGNYNMSGKYDPFGEDADLDFGQYDETPTTNAEYYDPYEESIAGFAAELAKLTPGTKEYTEVYGLKVAMEALKAHRPEGPKRMYKRQSK